MSYFTVQRGDITYNAAFYQGLHCFLRQKKRSSEKDIQFKTCDPSIYTMDHPKFIVPNQKEKSILYIKINRGSYMSAHVLLNLLNELGKRDKMRGLPSILSLFRNKFDKFNNTRARMLDSIYHMTLRLLCRKTLYFCYVRNVAMDVITFPVNL